MPIKRMRLEELPRDQESGLVQLQEPTVVTDFLPELQVAQFVDMLKVNSALGVVVGSGGGEDVLFSFDERGCGL